MAEPVVVEVPHRESVRHRWLEIRVVPSGEVVTVIEILSPVNKRPGEGRDEYERKRSEVLGSRAHLVEIDLLRADPPMEFRPVDGDRRSAYRILVSRAPRRPRAELYPFDVRDPVPRFPLPLREGDAEPVVDLGARLHGLYDRASYDLAVGYPREPDPPLSAAAAAWARQMLKAQTSSA
jgi:hypothetical protein